MAHYLKSAPVARCRVEDRWLGPSCKVSIITASRRERGSGFKASLRPRATSALRLEWRRGSGYPALDDPIRNPLGELHHAQVMGSGRLRSQSAQSESAVRRELTRRLSPTRTSISVCGPPSPRVKRVQLQDLAISSGA